MIFSSFDLRTSEQKQIAIEESDGQYNSGKKLEVKSLPCLK